MRVFSCFAGLLLSLIAIAQENSSAISLAAGERVWAGIIVDGTIMPLKPGYVKDFYGDNYGNQTQPLIITSKGQYVWSEEPYKFEMIDSSAV